MAEETIEQLKALQLVRNLEVIYHNIQRDGYHPYLVESMGVALSMIAGEYNAKYVSPDEPSAKPGEDDEPK